ncbi:MAG: alpha-galactosidase, partial [Actinomycetota bacterium]
MSRSPWPTARIVHFRRAGISLLMDVSSLPRVVYWGGDLGDLDEEELAAVALALTPQVGSAVLDQLVPVSVVPEQSKGWLGTPGLSGHRDGRDFSPLFVVCHLGLGDGTIRVTAR